MSGSEQEQPRRGTPDAPWTVVSALARTWHAAPGWGRFVKFEDPDGPRWPQYGFNIQVLEPGDISTMYHGEAAQEDFVVLAGRCLAIVEGEEVRLEAWDVLHCPPWTRHGFKNDGDAACAILMIGGRQSGEEYEVEYPVDAAALKHGTGVEAYTTDGDVAYAETTDFTDEAYRSGTLPGA
jgi:uncharacterized cupin superfamily protein